MGCLGPEVSEREPAGLVSGLDGELQVRSQVHDRKIALRRAPRAGRMADSGFLFPIIYAVSCLFARGGPDLVKIGATTSATEGFAPELLAVALFKGESPQDLGEDAARVLSDGDFSGKLNETALLYGQQGPARRLLLVGLG